MPSVGGDPQAGRWTEVALEAADLAQQIFDRHRGDWAQVRDSVASKRDAADLVTVIDTETETAVRDLIARRLPGHVVVGEEFGGVAGADVPTWYCDPVDGTMNLAHGLPWSSFSLAVARGTTPVAGVVLDPWRREVVWAEAGSGAWRSSDPERTSTHRLVVADSTGLAGHLMTTEWANQHPWPGMLGMLEALAETGCTARIMGSGTLAVTEVGLGRSVAAVIGRFQPEDHLAATVIAREAGALVGDWGPVEGWHESRWPQGILVVAAPGVLGELCRALAHPHG